MYTKNYVIVIIMISFFVITGLVCAPAIHAQWAVGLTLAQRETWAALPPYNIMWPLWSSTLSPLDPVTGLPTPLISELASDTVLPVQPVMGLCPTAYEWPMDVVIPWLFYNSPQGVVFYDAYYGFNPWPPPSFLDPVSGAPIPIALPANYTIYALPDLKESQFLIESANLLYTVAYGIPLGINPGSLLTFAELWGDVPLIFAGGIPF
ncbi:MAG: hypothetical protein ACMUJM_04760 [bacterium]